ncbi:MAG: DsbA family protein [Bacteroidota bacterium]
MICFIIFMLGLTASLHAQNTMENKGFYCDPETGLCTIPHVDHSAATTVEFKEDEEIIYVGDPMCSWCWGISPALHQLEVSVAQQGLPFRIVVGGLRPGGGDPWNEQFQDFLKHHWAEVNERSGQPFGYTLFERETFNYDTEPSCRAVIVARKMDPAQEHHFFELVQHYFYVRSEDPTEAEFYRPICKELGLDYEQFVRLFNSQEVRDITQAEFAMNRQWGVRGYPTVLYRKADKLYLIARGYATFEQMQGQIDQFVKVESNP